MSEVLSAVCGAVRPAPTAALLQHSLPARLDGRLEEAHLPPETVSLLSWWRRLLTAHCRPVRLAAWHLMHRSVDCRLLLSPSRPKCCIVVRHQFEHR